MDLRQFRYAVAVADAGSFTRAAEQLGVAQPSLSQGVRSLEAEVGAELFRRGGPHIVPTAAGEAFLGPARQALRDAEVARAAVADVVGLFAGHLDLVALPTLAVDPVAGLIGAFRRRHPGTTVRLAEPESAAAIVDAVRSGVSELGFTELPVAPSGGGAGLTTVELDSHEFWAVLPPAGVAPVTGPAAAGGGGATATDDVDAGLAGFLAELPAGPIGVATLARLPLVTTPPGTSTRRLVDEAFARSGRSPSIAVETDHREAIAALVVQGAGVSVLPESLARDAAARGARVRPLRPALRRRVGVVHRAGLLSPAARALLALASPATPSRAERPRPRRRTT